MALNVEIKAKCAAPDEIREILKSLGGEYKGKDHQIDTYFKVAHGRLKLREGNIEKNLIQYHRSNQAGPKSSFFQLFPVSDSPQLKAMLSAANGILAVVDKQRDIFFIDNVKFHVDEVKGLGSFVEIEAGDLLKPSTEEALLAQCENYMKLLNISNQDLIENSYSDLILAKHDHEG